MAEKDLSVSTNKLFEDLDKKIDDAFRNQLVMAIYQSIPRQYGPNLTLSEIDMHALGYIQKNPGITAKSLGELMYRTKGTISTIISRLEQEGFLKQEINPSNRREHCLFLTQKGQETCSRHTAFDRQKTSEFIIYLSQFCTPEEIDGFFKVLYYRTLFFENAIKKDREEYKEVSKSSRTAK